MKYVAIGFFVLMLWCMSMTANAQPEWETHFYDDFEGNWIWGSWGNWTDGGSYASLDTSGTHSYTGNSCVRLRHQSGWSSSTYTNSIPSITLGHQRLQIDFRWKAENLLNGERLGLYYYNGSYAHLIQSYIIGEGYSNNHYYHSIETIDILSIPPFTFTDSGCWVLMSQIASSTRNIYIDHVYVNSSVFLSTPNSPNSPASHLERSGVSPGIVMLLSIVIALSMVVVVMKSVLTGTITVKVLLMVILMMALLSVLFSFL